jgi:outer membrane receptor protein involved in Fe transport
MRRTCRRRAAKRGAHPLAVLLIAGLSAGSGPAAADEADPKTPPQTAQTSPAAGSEPFQLPAVTVIGEKSVRSLQDTASSVSVMTGDDLAKQPGITDLRDAMQRMPNVVDSGNGNFAPTIRGDDSTGPANGVFAFLGGTRPRVTIQQDGRPLTFNELVYGREGLWDVDRIEVLRGPQTTLQGRNSIAGAVIVETKDPTFVPEGALRVLGGDYGTRQASGMVSGPIGGDQLAVRLSADQRLHESWVDVTGDVGVPHPEHEEATNLRGKILLVPDGLPDFSAKLTLNHVDTRRPQTEFVTPPIEERKNDGSATFPVFKNRADSSILELGYDLGSGLALHNTTSYSSVRIDRLTSPGTGIAKINTDEVTNEFLANYHLSGLRGVAGAYFLAADSDESIDIGGGNFDDSTRTFAIFGEATLTFLERWDLTVGGRYEREKRKRFGSASVFNIDLDETFDAFMPKLGLAYRAADNVTVGATVQRGWNAGGAGIAFVPPFPSFTYGEEYVWNYEAFVRSTWLDKRLVVNGNVFFADYKDQQRLAYLVPGDPSSGVIRNVDKSHSYGAELSGSWLATRQLEINGSLGLLATKIDEFTASVQDLDGNQFARAPNVTASIGATYRFAGGFSVGVDGRYVGTYFSDDDNDPTEKVGSRFIVDAQAGYTLENLRFFAFVNNIFDRDDPILLFDGNAQLVDPLEFGVGFELRF